MRFESADQLIHWGALQLEQAGIDEANLQARRLFFYVTHGDSFRSVPRMMRVHSEEQIRRYENVIARRLSREPFQHIVGEVGFMGIMLKTDARALIPRDDTGEVALLALERLSGKTLYECEIADLGTGSGAILAGLLDQLPNASGVAVEQSSEALSLARENFETLGFLARIELFEGSWTEWTGWDTPDLIVSNPPYIESAVLQTLQPEVRDHDPAEALDGGVDGLDAYREIITLAAAKMKPGAHLVFEIGYDQKAAVTKLLEDAAFTQITHAKDLGGQDRAIAAQAPKQKTLGETDSSR